MFRKYGIFILLSIILIITIGMPLLMTLPALFGHADYTTTGEIGDTVGGITAPFINGLSAILVYLAFRAQIDANKLIQKQEIYRTILAQIKSIQDADNSNFAGPVSQIHDRLADLMTPNSPFILEQLKILNLFLFEIVLTSRLISDLEIDEGDFYLRKLSYLFKSKYWTALNKLNKSIFDNGYHQGYQDDLIEFKTNFEYLKSKLMFMT